VVGPLLGAQPGESLRLQGRWASHPQYGRQFQVEAYTTMLPATIQGIRRYLGSGLRAIVTLARAKRAKVVLAAPTGRAAKRLGELAGLDAATLHRLLQLRPGGDAAFDRDHPLDADLVVVDEASMLDVLLANKLVKAVPPGAHLLVVGDVDQLPSVRGRRGAARPPRG
jgi:ATP-dependent exoDNAse (exonuclease V) alpha subunit